MGLNTTTFVLCLILTTLPLSVAFEWISAIAPANGTTVPACSGQDVTLAWNYSTAADEHLINVEWHHAPPGSNEVLLATLVMGNFFTAPGSPVHVQYIPYAGIRLQNVAVTDAGTYSVHVNVNLHGSVITEVQAVTVEVSDASVTTDGQLHIKMLPEAVYDNSTQEFNVQLVCGEFRGVWGSRASVAWKTPTNQTLPSTSYQHGNFLLSVPNPVVNGEYTCVVDDNSPASLCVKSDSPLRRGATVVVDGTEARLAIMEARIQFLQAEEARHQQEIAELQQQLASMKNRSPTAVQPFVPCDQLPGDSPSGVYTVPLGMSTLSVWCDQDMHNGGWTVIQRRLDGSVDFYRNWTQYEDGFGNLEGEYWLGLSTICRLTSSQNCELRVDMETFTGTSYYAEYSHFSVSGPGDYYRLNVSGYSGNAGGDSLAPHNDHQFSTQDADHDPANDVNCAADRHGAWWYTMWYSEYTGCANSNLNGRYITDGYSGHDVVFWDRVGHYSLKSVSMKIRPTS